MQIGDRATMENKAEALRRLSQDALTDLSAAVSRPAYDRNLVSIGVVHFGPGVFHRAHQAFYLDRILAWDPRWGICGVSLRSSSMQVALKPQDWLYTLAVLGEPTTFQVIGSLKEVLVAPHQQAEVMSRLVASTTRVVSITVTEKGYCTDRDGNLDTGRAEIAHDLRNPHSPESLVGWLVEGLRLRRAAGLAPFTVISCDNLIDNGARLRRAAIQFAEETDNNLARWIEDKAAFPRTMVDSIAPATDETLRADVRSALGLEDAWPVQRELFAQWVIEDVPGASGPDWAAIGVTVTRNISAFDRAKLKLLNTAHSTLAYVGILLGYESTAEAMHDDSLAEFIRALMLDDIVPTLRPTYEFDLPNYVQTILDRVRNPAIHHKLMQIAQDGSQKLPPRLFETLQMAMTGGRRIDRLAVPIAAWMRFACRQVLGGEEIVDPAGKQIKEAARACASKTDGDVSRFLALRTIFPADLAADRRFIQAVTHAFDILGPLGSGGTRRFPKWSEVS